MLAQAIEETKPTAPNKVNKAGITFPTISFMNALTIIPSPLLAAGLGLLQPCTNRVHLRSRLVDRNARLEPA